MNLSDKHIVAMLEFQGGMGNQLFQVATVLSIAKSLGRSFYIAPAIRSRGYTTAPVYTDTILQAVMNACTEFIPKNVRFIQINQFEFIQSSTMNTDENVVLILTEDYFQQIF